MAPKTNLPFVSSSIPPDLRQFLDRVRETLAGDTFVRRLDYLSGSVPRGPGEPPGPGPKPPPLPCGDPVTPTVPTGFRVFPGFSGFLLQWDMPEYCGHDRTEVYGLRHDGTSDDLTVNNMLGESQGVLYSHVVQRPGDYWCFWIKHVNKNDVEGPFVPAGLCGRTALDPGVLLDTLKQQITESQLYETLGDRINLIDLPGTGLIAQTQLLREQYADLASRTTEVSVVSGNRVWMTSLTPAEGNICFYNGGVRPELTTQALCEAYGGTWGSYKHREGDYWYNRSNGYGVDPVGNESHTLQKWVSGAWTTGTDSSLTFAPKAPTGTTDVLNETFWYDSSTHSDSLASKWFMYLNGAWRNIVDEFVNRVADAKVVDQEVARVGYCVDESVPANPVATNYTTRKACEEQTGHVWYPNLPWATAVKQVSVSTVDKCFISGGSYQQFCKLTAYTTEAACVAANGTWANYSTFCVRYDLNTQAACSAAGGSWVPYDETNCPGMRDEKSKPGLWVPGSSAAIEQKMQTLQDTSGALSGQYSLKIDAGGHVAGFGLSNELMTDGSQISRFLIRADQFGVAGDSFAGSNAPVHFTDAVLYDGFSWYDTDNKVTKYWEVTGAPSWVSYIPAFLQGANAPTVFLFTGRVFYRTTDGLTFYRTASNTWAQTVPDEIKSATAPVNPFHGQAWWDTSGAGALKICVFTASWTTDSAVAPIPFVVTTSPTPSDDGILIPPGVYMDAAYIKDATITGAKIKNLTVDNAKIFDLSADKITAGSINVGEYIQSAGYVAGSSGWKIDGSGSAEFQNALVRGTIQSSVLKLGSATDLYNGDGMYVNSLGSLRVGAESSDGAGTGYPTGLRVMIANNTVPSTRFFRVDVGVGGVLKRLVQFMDAADSCYLQSADFVTKTSGWKITGGGDSELNGVMIRGFLRSDTWNGTVDANNTILTPGTSGWALDRAGNGVFDTLHLRSGSVSSQGYYESAGPTTLPGASQWLASTAYYVGDVVWTTNPSSPYMYRCITAHTSGATFSSTNWVYYDDTGATKWVSGTAYSKNDAVWYSVDNKTYICQAYTTSALPTNTSYWVPFDHYKKVASITSYDLTNADATLGAMVFGRFGADVLINTSGSDPDERLAETPDVQVRVVFYDYAHTTRTILASVGYYLHCVGKSGSLYRHVLTVSDFTRLEGAKKGSLYLEAGNHNGWASVDIPVKDIALYFIGAKR